MFTLARRTRRGAGSRPRSTAAFDTMARLRHANGESTTWHKGKGPHWRRLYDGGAEGLDRRLRRRSDTRGSAVTYVGKRRRGERRHKGVGAAAGGAAKAAVRQPYRQRAECGWAATAARRSDTRGFRHRRSERHTSTLYGVGARVAHGARWRQSADE
jgi:hypothetical protein